MSVVGDLVQGVVETALREILEEGHRHWPARAAAQAPTLTASERLRRIERMLEAGEEAGEPPAPPCGRARSASAALI